MPKDAEIVSLFWHIIFNKEVHDSPNVIVEDFSHEKVILFLAVCLAYLAAQPFLAFAGGSDSDAPERMHYETVS